MISWTAPRRIQVPALLHWAHPPEGLIDPLLTIVHKVGLEPPHELLGRHNLPVPVAEVRLHACGSNPSPSSAAISRSAASIISCRSSCLSFTSMVLLTPACWHHQRSGGGEARWPLVGDRNWSNNFDQLRLKSPGANSTSFGKRYLPECPLLFLFLQLALLSIFSSHGSLIQNLG